MYWNEGDHAIPHFHAHHAGRRVSIGLDGSVIAGDIDAAALRHVLDWTLARTQELQAKWERARRAEPILPIEPLE
jgi:hypothetical protein